jgi:hypothetical protein
MWLLHKVPESDIFRNVASRVANHDGVGALLVLGGHGVRWVLYIWVNGRRLRIQGFFELDHTFDRGQGTAALLVGAP